MKAADLLQVLDEQDKTNHLWLFNMAMLRVLFPSESNNSLKMSLRRHVKAKLLTAVARGLYANERAQSAVCDKLFALIPYLKPNEMNYLSQETRLSELGLISQLPLNYVSVMTRGTSQVFKTPYGTVQFTHTKKPLVFILEHTTLAPHTALLQADAMLALKDLKAAQRNMGMVAEQLQKAEA